MIMHIPYVLAWKRKQSHACARSSGRPLALILSIHNNIFHVHELTITDIPYLAVYSD